MTFIFHQVTLQSRKRLHFKFNIADKMKSLTLIGIFVIFFCNLAKGEFEERTELSFQVRAIYKGEQVEKRFSNIFKLIGLVTDKL